MAALRQLASVLRARLPAHVLRKLYLTANHALSFTAPTALDGFDEYFSDPQKPVTYRLRPIRPTYAEGSTWDYWLVEDQRFAADRPDVLVLYK